MTANQRESEKIQEAWKAQQDANLAEAYNSGRTEILPSWMRPSRASLWLNMKQAQAGDGLNFKDPEGYNSLIRSYEARLKANNMARDQEIKGSPWLMKQPLPDWDLNSK